MSAFKYKHGLCVMRAQPFHIGHQKVVDRMLENCEVVTIALGSVQENGTARNPLDYATRRQLLHNIYGNEPRLKIVGLFDINNPAEWGNFVLNFVRESFPDTPEPDVYYAGSSYDAHWFKNCVPHVELVDRSAPDFPFVSGTMVREMIKFGDIRWKNFVAPENHQLIEQYFHLVR